MKILVTGGAGYVGSHACKALRAAGFEPVTFDNLSRGHRWAVKWGPLEQGDIRDAGALRKAIEVHRPAAVMHFAALCAAGDSVSDPAAYYQTNVNGTLTLLEAMRHAGIARIVFSSTCAIYGDSNLPRIPEDAAKNPVSPYGASKLMAERILADCAAAYGMSACCLRYFNAAGADPEGETGADHDPETLLIPVVLQAAAGKRAHVEVYGTDYPTPDGTGVRDFIHVTDLAEAHVLALKESLAAARGTTPGKFRAYNLGTGKGHSVKQVIDAARKITGRPITAIQRPRRPGDPIYAVADASLAARDLGWQPRYAALEAIVDSAWKWALKGPPGA